jgi:hypothetical protein
MSDNPNEDLRQLRISDCQNPKRCSQQLRNKIKAHQTYGKEFIEQVKLAALLLERMSSYEQ